MGADLCNREYTRMDKTIQLSERPRHDLRHPRGHHVAEHLKQIVVMRVLSFRFSKLVEEIRPGFWGRSLLTCC